MHADIDDGFHQFLEIALRLVDQQPRKDYAARLPHLRDQGAARVATQVMRRLELAGWQIHAPPPPPIDLGM